MIIGILGFGLMIAVAANADEHTRAGFDSLEIKQELKLDLARAYFELPAVKELNKGIAGFEVDMFKDMTAMLGYDEEHMNAIEKLIHNELMIVINTATEIMIDEMANLYTLEELEVQYEFYSSEVGSSIIKKNGFMLENLMTSSLIESQMKLIETLDTVFEMEKSEVLNLASNLYSWE